MRTGEKLENLLWVVSVFCLALLTSQPAAAQTTIFGVVSAGGNVVSGSGFTVQFIPAGSGTTLLANVRVENGSSYVSCPNYACSQLKVKQWLEIDNGFYQVAEVINHGGDVELTTNYAGQGGNSIPAYINMNIWNAYAVTFTTPFQSTPAVTFGIEGIGSNGSTPLAGSTYPPVAVFDGSAAGQGLSNTGFQIYQEPTEGPPSFPGATATWTFTAVGN